MNKILQEDFDLAPCMVAGYESFMDGLLNIVHSGPICESVWVNRSSRMCWILFKITRWILLIAFRMRPTCGIISAGIRNPAGRLS